MVDVIAPVTDYLSDSILTTRGDLLKRGVVDTERLPRGSTRQSLVINSTGADPVWECPVNSIFYREYSAYNTSIITISIGTHELLSLNLYNVSIGDRLLVNAMLKAGKTGAAGLMHFQCLKASGTAVIQSFHSNTSLHLTGWQTANQYIRWMMSGIFKVTTAGTLVLRTVATSEGSDANCLISEAELYVNAMKQ